MWGFMLVYIDESGYPVPTDPNPFSTWAAILIPEPKIRIFDREIFRVKKQWLGAKEPTDCEIKASNLLSPSRIKDKNCGFRKL